MVTINYGNLWMATQLVFFWLVIWTDFSISSCIVLYNLTLITCPEVGALDPNRPGSASHPLLIKFFTCDLAWFSLPHHWAKWKDYHRSHHLLSPSQSLAHPTGAWYDQIFHEKSQSQVYVWNSWLKTLATNLKFYKPCMSKIEHIC